MLGTLPIEYKILTENFVDEAVNCIAETFLCQEPLTAHLKVDVDDFKKFAKDLIIHAYPTSLSWVALNTKSKQVIGARIITDYQDDFHPSISYGSRMDTILKFLSAVTNGAPLLVENNQKIMHAHMVAVNEAYQGQGVARRLLEISSLHGLARGYGSSIGEVASQANYRILSRYRSFTPLHSVRFDKYKTETSKPFKQLSHLGSCVLFKLELAEFRR